MFSETETVNVSKPCPKSADVPLMWTREGNTDPAKTGAQNALKIHKALKTLSANININWSSEKG